MARNREKQQSSLNRILLEKERIAREEKHPKRPPLSRLNTAAEIRQWLPGIQADLDYCLTQMSGVRNYRDKKISEFEEKVKELEIEYKRFVAKLSALDETEKGRGKGSVRAYVGKKVLEDDPVAMTLPKRIPTPLLDAETGRKTEVTKDNKNPLGIDYSSSSDDDG